MNKKFLVVCSFLTIIGMGCSTKNVSVKKTPKASVVSVYDGYDVVNGYPKYSKPWVVYAAKIKTPVYPNAKFEEGSKYANFLESFIVLKQSGDMFQVAAYKKGSIKEDKIDKSLLKAYGWIHKADLLLWSGALKNKKNGFYLKGVLTINNKSVIEDSEKFIQSDSVVVYGEPSLMTATTSKLPINDMVYLYQISEDKKKALIGRSPLIDVDMESNSLLGWIDTRILTIWGDRTAVKYRKDSWEAKSQLGLVQDDGLVTTFKPLKGVNDFSQKKTVSSIFPVKKPGYANTLPIQYLTNVLDYNANRIYNVMGQPIYFNKYREIVANNKKLNLIFIMDGGTENKNSLYILKSLFQDLEMSFLSEDYFEQISYSGVFYNTYRCASNQSIKLTRDYRDVTNLIDNQNSKNCPIGGMINLAEATVEIDKMLARRSNETNVVIVVGNTIKEEEQNREKEIVNRFLNLNARLVFYQYKANRANDFNNFVLFGEQIVLNTANKIIETKKEKLVNHDDVLSFNSFDISKGAEGIFRLDYPENSMHQGAIVFPRKGEESKPMLLKNAMERLINDVVLDNKRVDSTLTVYFKSVIGVSNTSIEKDFEKKYGISTPNVATKSAIELLDQDHSFLVDGFVETAEGTINDDMEYGVLLDEYELEQLHNYYLSVYYNVFKNNATSNRKMVRRYMHIAKNRTQLFEGLSRKSLRKNTMQSSMYWNTGLFAIEPDLSMNKLNKWKRKKYYNPKMVREHFASYKTNADKITDTKGDKEVRINHHGTYLYWLNGDYIPKLDVKNSKAQEKEIAKKKAREQLKTELAAKEQAKEIAIEKARAEAKIREEERAQVRTDIQAKEEVREQDKAKFREEVKAKEEAKEQARAAEKLRKIEAEKAALQKEEDEKVKIEAEKNKEKEKFKQEADAKAAEQAKADDKLKEQQAKRDQEAADALALEQARAEEKLKEQAKKEQEAADALALEQARAEEKLKEQAKKEQEAADALALERARAEEKLKEQAKKEQEAAEALALERARAEEKLYQEQAKKAKKIADALAIVQAKEEAEQKKAAEKAAKAQAVAQARENEKLRKIEAEKAKEAAKVAAKQAAFEKAMADPKKQAKKAKKDAKMNAKEAVKIREQAIERARAMEKANKQAIEK